MRWLIILNDGTVYCVNGSIVDVVNRDDVKEFKDSISAIIQVRN